MVKVGGCQQAVVCIPESEKKKIVLCQENMKNTLATKLGPRVG